MWVALGCRKVPPISGIGYADCHGKKTKRDTSNFVNLEVKTMTEKSIGRSADVLPRSEEGVMAGN